MILQAAKQILVKDQLDWNRPHLTWMPDNLYRLSQEAHPRAEPKASAGARLRPIAAPSGH